MESIQRAFFLVLFLLFPFVLGFWLYSTFSSSVREFTRVVPLSAYLDSKGDFLICVYNGGPHDFYGVWVVSLSTGQSTQVQLFVKVGERGAVRGSLGGSFTPGTSPVLAIATGGGSTYHIVPIVVPDVSSVTC